MRGLWGRGLSERYDIAVVGSGYAGSLMAMVVRRLGFRVVMLEKGKHPRVVIGESSTPLSNLLLEELAEKYDLPKVKPLCKWGTWQETYPQVGCGLKRGFTFFHHGRGWGAAEQMLVAASPNDAIADTHWYRADFDELLMEQARELGVEFVDEARIEVKAHDAEGWRLSVEREGVAREFIAAFVIDATGPRGFLHQALKLEEEEFATPLETSAVYSHFAGVKEFAPAMEGAPYPPDAAALHHVFDGGWMWVLRFNNGMTSAGVVARREVARKLRFEETEGAWERVLARLPAVREQFAGARAEMPFTYLPQVSYMSARVVGSDWAMLPSAAGFVDPMMSTGFSLSLLGVTRLGRMFEEDWGRSRMGASLAEYAVETKGGLSATADLISALYANMGDFEVFRTVSLLYFAAASYAETARRLGRVELADSFLLSEHPRFGVECRRLLELARMGLKGEALVEGIYALIAEFDVAGLGKRPADHCYPVDAQDLYEAADKFGARRGEIDRMLERAGFLRFASE